MCHWKLFLPNISKHCAAEMSNQSIYNEQILPHPLNQKTNTKKITFSTNNKNKKGGGKLTPPPSIRENVKKTPHQK